MTDLTWTDEPPSEAGWYWIRNHIYPLPDPHIVRVTDGTATAFEMSFSDAIGAMDVVEYPDAQWAGPIPEPNERTEHQPNC